MCGAVSIPVCFPSAGLIDSCPRRYVKGYGYVYDVAPYGDPEAQQKNGITVPNQRQVTF